MAMTMTVCMSVTIVLVIAVVIMIAIVVMMVLAGSCHAFSSRCGLQAIDE